jgi:hypothetical protein
MRALGVELRRGPGLPAFPLLVLLQAFGTRQLLWPGSRVWENATSALVGAVQLVGPIAAGLAAWAAGRQGRRGTSYLPELAARPVWHAAGAQLVASAAWPLAAYLLVSVGVFGWTAAGATWQAGPDLLWWAAGGAGLALHSVLGDVAGRSVPRPWLPPLAAVACYGVVAWNLSKAGREWYFLSPVTVQLESLFRDVDNQLFLGQLAWYAGLAVLAVAAWALVATTDSHTVPATAVALGLVATVIGGLVVNSTHGRPFVGKPTALRYRCAGTAPQVCVHPAFAEALPELQRQFTTLARRLAGTPAGFTRIEQRPRGVGSTPSLGAAAFHLDSLERDYPLLAAAEYLDEHLGGGAACTDDSDDARAGADYALLVRAWLLDRALFIPATDDERRALRWFLERTDGERSQWLRVHFPKLTTCTLGPEDFR